MSSQAPAGEADPDEWVGLARPSGVHRSPARAPDAGPGDGAWRHLGERLDALPPRWGWEPNPSAITSAPTVALPEPPQRPRWVEPPPQTDGARALKAERSQAVSRLVRRIALTVVVFVAYTTYQFSLEAAVGALGYQASQVFSVAVLVVGALLAISVVRSIAQVGAASRAIARYEVPFRQLRAAERERHDRAVADWQRAVAEHEARVLALTRTARTSAQDGHWFPVAPVSEPTRVDVVGGDPRRNGWASLLVTVGTSALGAGARFTVIDLSGRDAAGGLANVARARGRSVRRVDLGASGNPINLFAGAGAHDAAACLAEAVAPRSDAPDSREARALVSEMLSRASDALAPTVTLARLAAAVRVLRTGTPDPSLTEEENELVIEHHLADADRSEWVQRQLRLTAGQITALEVDAPGQTGDPPLIGQEQLTIVTTPAGTDDNDETLDRLVVRLVSLAVERHELDGFLVVAGADRLGARTIEALNDRAARSHVRLVLMTGQAHGDLERTIGTGGAVCVMKMYNHKDATMAAELIGRGHKFVVSQLTRQVGTTLSDGGGDSVSSNSGDSDGSSRTSMGKRTTNTGSSRGKTWTDNRTWGSSDSSSVSATSTRVYEFDVEPSRLMSMPETSFILIDSSGSGRRVVMADGNPGICLQPGVSRTPLAAAAR